MSAFLTFKKLPANVCVYSTYATFVHKYMNYIVLYMYILHIGSLVHLNSWFNNLCYAYVDMYAFM